MLVIMENTMDMGNTTGATSAAETTHPSSVRPLFFVGFVLLNL